MFKWIAKCEKKENTIQCSSVLNSIKNTHTHTQLECSSALQSVKRIVKMFLWSVLVVIFKEPTSLSSFSWSSSSSSSTLKHSNIPPTKREQSVLVSFGQFLTIIMSLSKFYAPNLHCHKPINMLAMLKKIQFQFENMKSPKIDA
jgi:hypothetical protein